MNNEMKEKRGRRTNDRGRQNSSCREEGMEEK